MTQQNAAMVEESSAASTALKTEAETLHGMVTAFRLKARKPESAANADGEDAGAEPEAGDWRAA